jgi:hypothetical protein
VILCRIAHISRKTSLRCDDRLDWPVLGQKLKVSNSDRLFLCEWAIIVLWCLRRARLLSLSGLLS